MMSKGDRWLIALLVAIGCLFLVWRALGGPSQSAEVEVRVKGRLTQSFPLLTTEEKEYTIDLPNGVAVLEVREGAVRLLPLDKEICPRHICSHTGWIRKGGESIICLPNQLVIRIIDPNGEPVDAISR